MTAASARFNTIAVNFATSEVHSNSPTVRRLHELIDGYPQDAVCDLACGAGHLALSFAGRAHRIVAVDPAPNMLAMARELASARGIDLETVQANAESVPLPDASYDVVASKLAAHHFTDVGQAVAEMARLARPGGVVAVIDLQGDDDPEVDAFNHGLEVLHDPTHGRSYTGDTWSCLFESAGLVIEAFEPRQRESLAGVSIKRWCEIASSGVDAERAIRARLVEAPLSVLDALDIKRDGDEFYVPVRTLLIVGRKPW